MPNILLLRQDPDSRLSVVEEYASVGESEIGCATTHPSGRYTLVKVLKTFSVQPLREKAYGVLQKAGMSTADIDAVLKPSDGTIQASVDAGSTSSDTEDLDEWYLEDLTLRELRQRAAHVTRQATGKWRREACLSALRKATEKPLIQEAPTEAPPFDPDPPVEIDPLPAPTCPTPTTASSTAADCRLFNPDDKAKVDQSPEVPNIMSPPPLAPPGAQGTRVLPPIPPPPLPMFRRDNE